MGSFSTPFQVSEVIQAQTLWAITRHRFTVDAIEKVQALCMGRVLLIHWSTSSPSWEEVGTNKSGTPKNKIRGWRRRLLFFDVNPNKEFFGSLQVGTEKLKLLKSPNLTNIWCCLFSKLWNFLVSRSEVQGHNIVERIKELSFSLAILSLLELYTHRREAKYLSSFSKQLWK